MDKIKEILELILMVIIGMSLYALFMSLPVYFLWNWLVPELFSIRGITFYESIGLTYLSKCLFSNTESKK
jgi:hypothetical protein